MFIDNLNCDEIRDGFLVKSEMKHVWEVQLHMLSYVDKICKENNICYWVGWGNLLGACMYKGYVPWDDDFDIIMPRPDYNRFRKILFMNKNVKYDCYSEDMYMLKLQDNDTTICFSVDPLKCCGILIDISALDVVPFDCEDYSFCALRELFSIYKNSCNVENKYLDKDLFKDLTSKPKSVVFECFCEFAEYVYDDYSYIGELSRYYDCNRVRSFYNKNLFKETLYMPYELTTVPVPNGYNEILKIKYGEITKSPESYSKLGLMYSCDISFKNFLNEIDPLLYSKRRSIYY